MSLASSSLAPAAGLLLHVDAEADERLRNLSSTDLGAA